jgi:hypothetical protein
MNEEQLKVLAAVIIKDERYLVCQRPKAKRHGQVLGISWRQIGRQ